MKTPYLHIVVNWFPNLLSYKSDSGEEIPREHCPPGRKTAKATLQDAFELSPLRGHRAFTLIELLVATAIFMILVLVLASISNQALQTWRQNENKSDLREAARTAMNLIGSELRQAVLPVDPESQTNLQLVVNPTWISATFKNRDAIFWQAPIATSRSKGDLAIVGYFVRKEGGIGKLCRIFINPDDPDYAMYSGQQSWVNDALLNLKAPATEASDLKGLFLENVPGLWVTAYTNSSTPYGTDYDSRTAKVLPSRVEITLALMDQKGAQRVADGVTLPIASSYSNAVAFQDALPTSLRPHVETVTISVGFK